MKRTFVIAALMIVSMVLFWSLLIFPLLFTAGMSLVDTTDSVLMVRAYGWAFVKPIRRPCRSEREPSTGSS